MTLVHIDQKNAHQLHFSFLLSLWKKRKWLAFVSSRIHASAQPRMVADLHQHLSLLSIFVLAPLITPSLAPSYHLLSILLLGHLCGKISISMEYYFLFYLVVVCGKVFWRCGSRIRVGRVCSLFYDLFVLLNFTIICFLRKIHVDSLFDSDVLVEIGNNSFSVWFLPIHWKKIALFLL